MKLGELILQYRTEHGLSQRKFAEICGISYGYIGTLEKGVHPKTGKPIIPTFEKIYKIANAMNMAIDEFCRKVDSETTVRVESTNRELPASEEKMLALFRLLPDDQKTRILENTEFALRIQGLL